MKPRVRLYAAGQTFFRLVSEVKGWRGPYGQTWCGAKWACIVCGRLVGGDNQKPSPRFRPAFGDWPAEWIDVCARNGHAPCAYCGKQLPRLNDACPRAHPWRRCPGKTEAARMVGQHAHPAEHVRSNP